MTFKFVITLTKFSQGQFTQTLQTLRRPKQESDTKQVSVEETGPVTKDKTDIHFSSTDSIKSKP